MSDPFLMVVDASERVQDLLLRIVLFFSNILSVFRKKTVAQHRERLLTIHLMELLRKDGKYAIKLGLEPSIKVRVLAGKKYSGGAHGAERESQ